MLFDFLRVVRVCNVSPLCKYTRLIVVEALEVAECLLVVYLQRFCSDFYICRIFPEQR